MQTRRWWKRRLGSRSKTVWVRFKLGLEREIKVRQNEKLIVQEGIESVKLKERKILAEQAKRLVKTKVDFNQNYDRELKTAY